MAHCQLEVAAGTGTEGQTGAGRAVQAQTVTPEGTAISTVEEASVGTTPEAETIEARNTQADLAVEPAGVELTAVSGCGAVNTVLE